MNSANNAKQTMTTNGPAFTETLTVCVGGSARDSKTSIKVLRDIQKVCAAAKTARSNVVVQALDNPLTAALSPVFRVLKIDVKICATMKQAMKGTSIVLFYNETEEDADVLADVRDEMPPDAQLFIRDTKVGVAPPPPKLRQPDGNPYADFDRAVNRLRRRIRRVPTKGPQVVRVVELRPAPWTTM